jgi:hypothetical protein
VLPLIERRSFVDAFHLVAPEAAWLNGNNLEKERKKEEEMKKERTNERKGLTLTGNSWKELVEASYSRTDLSKLARWSRSL